MADIKELKDALGFTSISEFMKEWKQLTPEDKEVIEQRVYCRV